MGDTCGPCFDRRADGGTAASGYGHFSGWQGYQPYVGFSHDGTRLVGPHLSNKIRTVDRSDGSAVMSRAMVGTLSAIAGTPDGFVLGLANGSVVRWDGAGGLHRILGSPQMYGRPALSPDGRRMVVLTQNAGFTADLAAGRPVYERVDGARTYAAVRFSNDGRRLFALTTQGELVSLAPDTLAPTVLRANVSDGIPRFGYMHDLVVSPDGSTLAVIRETNYPAGLTVRVIPLEENRPAFDLPLPGWHRPNAAAFSPDGSHLVTADPQAGWVGFWRLPSGKALGFARAVPEDPSWRSGQIVFSPDGRAVAVLYSGFHQERGSTVVVWPWPDVVTAASG
jgi:sugar lactone lactonase YvrE